ncbi:mitochondrial-type heat shock protein 70 [Fusarium langsethiae]|uniref:Mitochondrial-type heat shock protein 70 n=1 Tax=Fusarium langsethiae TaxID=179993 RepID=A0A0M9EZ79_FUSLA|nr:mitochondrial-type heat shock protein 70 [Fusarium langsethiae]GKU02102.1 unnamed protein product [Fusarium langsethiae]GKU18992.1 unnamed protein product [Fusarium langsethiae]
MAGLHEARKGPRMQEDDVPSDSSCRISGTIAVGISLGTVSSGISHVRFNPQGLTIPRCYIYASNLPGVSGSRIDAEIPTEHLKDWFLEWFEVFLLRNEDLPSDSDFHGSLKCSVYDFKYNLVMTVPGIWPVYARYEMRQAIRKADILSDKVDMIPKSISEVEAASIALVLKLSRPRDVLNFQPPILENRDIAIVCDCGSFTTESTAYKISSIQPLDMKQITRGGCVFAGPALMDNVFMSLLKAKIAKSCPDFAIHLTGQHFREFACHHWGKDMKPNFCGGRREWTFPVPDLYGSDTEQTMSFSA